MPLPSWFGGSSSGLLSSSMKRFLKFVLKRQIGRYLQSELDVEQLSVELGAGRVVLRNVLLDCAVLNKDLALDGWYVRSGFIGSIVAQLPLSSLGFGTGSCSVQVDEVLITVAPSLSTTSKPQAAPQKSDSPRSGSKSDALPETFASVPGLFDGDDLLLDDLGGGLQGPAGTAGVQDSIRNIAGSLKALLQQLKVEATNIMVRIELPLPPPQHPHATDPDPANSTSCHHLRAHGAPHHQNDHHQQQQQQHQHQPPYPTDEAEVAIATLHVDRLLFWDCSADAKNRHAGEAANPAPAHSTPSSSATASSSGRRNSSWGGWGRALGYKPDEPNPHESPPLGSRVPISTDPEFWSHFGTTAAGNPNPSSTAAADVRAGSSNADEELGKVWGFPVEQLADKAVLLAGVRMDLGLGKALKLGGEGSGGEEGGAASLASSFSASAGGSTMSAAPGTASPLWGPPGSPGSSTAACTHAPALPQPPPSPSILHGGSPFKGIDIRVHLVLGRSQTPLAPASSTACPSQPSFSPGSLQAHTPDSVGVGHTHTEPPGLSHRSQDGKGAASDRVDVGGGSNEASAKGTAKSGRAVCVGVDVSVGPVAVQLSPAHVPCVAALAHHFALQGSSSSSSSSGSCTEEGITGSGVGVDGADKAIGGLGHPYTWHTEAQTCGSHAHGLHPAANGSGSGAWAGQYPQSGWGREEGGVNALDDPTLRGWGCEQVGESEEGGCNDGGEEGGEWGRASLFADLMAPNYEDLVQHLLQPCLARSQRTDFPPLGPAGITSPPDTSRPSQLPTPPPFQQQEQQHNQEQQQQQQHGEGELGLGDSILFHDAHEQFSSSLASSMHSAAGPAGGSSSMYASCAFQELPILSHASSLLSEQHPHLLSTTQQQQQEKQQQQQQQQPGSSHAPVTHPPGPRQMARKPPSAPQPPTLFKLSSRVQELQLSLCYCKRWPSEHSAVQVLHPPPLPSHPTLPTTSSDPAHPFSHSQNHPSTPPPSRPAPDAGQSSTAQLHIQQPGLVLSCMDVGVEWHSGPQPGVHIAGTHLPGSSGSGDDGMGVKEGPSSTGSSCTSTSRSGQWASFSCYQLHVFDMVESAASAAAVLAAHVQPLDALGGARKPDGRAAPVSQQGAVAATDAAAAAAAAACASHEFAAIPSQLPQHSAQHSWPIPLWPPLPAALSQRTCSQDLPPARMGYGYAGPKAAAPAACFWMHAPELQPWPLLSCGSSPRAEGGRPSLLVKAQWEEPSSSHHSSSTGGVQQGGQAKRDRKAAEDPTQGSVRPEAAQWDKSAANPQLAGGNGAAGVARVGCRSHVELLPVTAWVCEASVARVTAALEPLMQALGSGSSKDSSTAGEGTSRPGPPSQQRQLVFEQHKPGDLGSRVGSSSDSLWVNSAGVKGSQERRDEAAQQQELSSTCLEVTLSVPQVCIVLMAAAAGMPGGAAGSEGPEQQVQRGVHHHHHQKDVGSQQCASGPRQGQQEPRSSAVGSSSSSSSSSSHTQNAVYIALDLMCGSHHPHVSLQRIPPHRGVPLLRVKSGEAPDPAPLHKSAPNPVNYTMSGRQSPLRLELAAAQLQVHLIHSLYAPVMPQEGTQQQQQQQQQQQHAPSAQGHPSALPFPSPPHHHHHHHHQIPYSNSSSRRILRRAMLFELRPSPQVAPPTDSSGHAPAGAGRGDGGSGPDDVPGGCGMFLAYTLQSNDIGPATLSAAHQASPTLPSSSAEEGNSEKAEGGRHGLYGVAGAGFGKVKGGRHGLPGAGSIGVESVGGACEGAPMGNNKMALEEQVWEFSRGHARNQWAESGEAEEEGSVQVGVWGAGVSLEGHSAEEQLQERCMRCADASLKVHLPSAHLHLGPNQLDAVRALTSSRLASWLAPSSSSNSGSDDTNSSGDAVGSGEEIRRRGSHGAIANSSAVREEGRRAEVCDSGRGSLNRCGFSVLVSARLAVTLQPQLSPGLHRLGAAASPTAQDMQQQQQQQQQQQDCLRASDASASFGRPPPSQSRQVDSFVPASSPIPPSTQQTAPAAFELTSGDLRVFHASGIRSRSQGSGAEGSTLLLVNAREVTLFQLPPSLLRKAASAAHSAAARAQPSSLHKGSAPCASALAAQASPLQQQQQYRLTSSPPTIPQASAAGPTSAGPAAAGGAGAAAGGAPGLAYLAARRAADAERGPLPHQPSNSTSTTPPTPDAAHPQAPSRGGAWMAPWLAPYEGPLCLLYCPRCSEQLPDALPCINVCMVRKPRCQTAEHQHQQQQHVPGQVLHEAQAGAGPAAGVQEEASDEEGLLSVVVRGVTVSTDRGHLTLTWMEQLGALAQAWSQAAGEGAAAGASGTAHAAQGPCPTHGLDGSRKASSRQGSCSSSYGEPDCSSVLEGRVACGGTGESGGGSGGGAGGDGITKVLTLQSIALRHEPLPYPPALAAAVAAPGVTSHPQGNRPNSSHGGIATTSPGAYVGGVGSSVQSEGQGLHSNTSAESAGAGSSTSDRVSGSGTAAASGGIGSNAAPSAPTPTFPGVPSAVALALLVEHCRFEVQGATRESSDRTSNKGKPPGATFQTPAHSQPLTPSGVRLQQQQQQRRRQRQLPQQRSEHVVVLRSLSLHLAHADHRGPDWAPDRARDVAGSDIKCAGYICVLQESMVRVQVRSSPYTASPPRPSPDSTSLHHPAHSSSFQIHHHHHQQQQQQQEHQTSPPVAVSVEVTNQHVVGLLTPTSASLLLQLSAQVSALLAATNPPRVPSTPSSHSPPHSTPPTQHPSAPPAAAAVAGVPGTAGNRPASQDVLHLDHGASIKVAPGNNGGSSSNSSSSRAAQIMAALQSPMQGLGPAQSTSRDPAQQPLHSQQGPMAPPPSSSSPSTAAGVASVGGEPAHAAAPGATRQRTTTNAGTSHGALHPAKCAEGPAEQGTVDGASSTIVLIDDFFSRPASQPPTLSEPMSSSSSSSISSQGPRHGAIPTPKPTRTHRRASGPPNRPPYPLAGPDSPQGSFGAQEMGDNSSGRAGSGSSSEEDNGDAHTQALRRARLQGSDKGPSFVLADTPGEDLPVWATGEDSDGWEDWEEMVTKAAAASANPFPWQGPLGAVPASPERSGCWYPPTALGYRGSEMVPEGKQWGADRCCTSPPETSGTWYFHQANSSDHAAGVPDSGAGRASLGSGTLDAQGSAREEGSVGTHAMGQGCLQEGDARHVNNGHIDTTHITTGHVGSSLGGMRGNLSRCGAQAGSADGGVGRRVMDGGSGSGGSHPAHGPSMVLQEDYITTQGGSEEEGCFSPRAGDRSPDAGEEQLHAALGAGLSQPRGAVFSNAGTGVGMQQQQQQQQQGWHGRLSGGGLGVQWAGRSGPRRDGMPRPLLRVLLKGMSGTWIMHMPSPASSSSVAPASEPHAQPLQCPQVAPTQPGEKCVEVQAEGVSVLMETYPQGGIPARRLRLNVHTFEVRECHPHPFATDSSLLHLIPHPLNGSPTRYTHQPPSHLSHRSSSSTSKGRAPPDFTAAPGLNPIRHSSATTAHLPGLHAAKTSSNLPSAANRALMGHRVGGALAAAAAGLLPGYRGGSTTRKRRSQGVKVLSYRAYKGRQRDSRACMLSLLLDWVRPSPRSHPETEELRLQVSLLPIHLHLDQDLLQSFRGLAAAAADPPTRAALHLLSALQLEAQGGESAPVLPFFQHVEISAARLTIDYRPRRIDVAALRDGSIMELVNLVPLGGLSLSLCPLRLAGMEGWDGLGARVAKEWCSHVARTQAHKFLTGLAPVHAVLSAGEAVTATLMAAPSSSLGRQLARGAAAVAAGASRSAVPMMAGLRAWRESAAAAQMRESVSHVARSVVQEALARGSSVAAAAAAGGVGGAAAPQWPMLAGASSAPPLAQSAADVMGQVSDTFGTTRPGQAADAEQRKDGIVGNSSTSSSRDAHGVNPFGGSKPLQAGISTVGRKSKSLLPKMWRKASASVVRKSFGQPLSPSSSSPSPGTFSPAHARQPMCPAGSEEEVPAQQPSNRSGSRSPVCEGGNHAGQAGRIGAACVVASGGRTLEPLPHWTHPAAFPQQQSCSQDAAVVLLDEWELLEGRASEAGATPPQQQLEDQVQERTMEHNGRVETLQHSSVESSASMEDRGAKVGGGGTAHLSGVEGCFPWTLSSVGEGQTAVKSCSRGSSSSSSSSSSTSGACDVCVDALDLPDLDDL